MRRPAGLLTLSFLLLVPELSGLAAQAAPVRGAAAELPTSVRWNRLVPGISAEAAARRRASRAAAAGDSAALRRIAQAPPPMPFRVYTVLSVAQYAAAKAAGPSHRASTDAAVASASAAVLSELYPDSVVRASIARELALDIARVRKQARGAARARAGQAMGEDIARRVIASAPLTDFAGNANVTPPTGPGMWRTARGMQPQGTMLGRSRTWVLDSAAQFRPAPPPVYDSPEFRAALEEVRQVARDRTVEQTRIARYWSDGDPWALWNEIASTALRRHRATNAHAARVFAVLNVAASDAIVACFEAKYHYWTLRPSQADSTLVLADSVPLPNFPSYPAGHACSAGAFEAVLTHFIPQDRAEFSRIAQEQAMARLYGGVHYRFDNDVGLALGRAVARHAVAADRRGALTASVAARRRSAKGGTRTPTGFPTGS